MAPEIGALLPILMVVSVMPTDCPSAVVAADVADVVDLVVARIAHGHSEHFVIGLGVIDHVEDSHGAHFDHAAGEARMGHHHQDVDRIAVVGDGAGNEAVIAGIVHGRIEGAVQAEDAELDIVFALVTAALGDLDDHADRFRSVRPRVNIG